MENRFIKLLSMFLVVVLLINMLPMSIFAEEFREQLTMQDSVSLEKIEAEDTYVVSELTDKRTQYTKEFLLSNGLHMATVYADPVHYEKDGQWVEIDNTLKTTRNGTVTNTAGIWNVSFPQQLNGGSVTIEKDGYTLSFAMDGELRSSGELMTAAMGTETAEQLAVGQLQTSTAAVQPTDTEALRSAYQHEEAAPEKLYSQLRYDGVYQNTDILYDLQANTVKESIVMGAYSSTLRGYRYTLNVGQLLPVLSDDGEITFFAPDRETVVMVMPAPYLLDANNEYNNDIQVQLTGSGSTYTLSYLLPRKWLAAENRAWPVILDPVVQADLDANNILDRTVAKNKDHSYTWSILDAGYSTTRGKIRSYLQFVNLPTITSSDVVVMAEFSLYKVETSATSYPVEIHKVTDSEPWDSQNITWDDQPDFSEKVEDYQDVRKAGWYNWNITDLVRDWYTTENNGLMLKMSDAIENGNTSIYRQFHSSDAGSSYRPHLFIYFRNNNGLESYWPYTSGSAGRAGTGHVNTFTGNLTWIRQDMGFGGNLMPVTIQHVYNANDVIIPDDDNNSNDSGSNSFGMGLGWRTNYNQLVYKWNQNSSYYVWEDGDGTDHYFEKVSGSTYKDEDGLELTLTVNSNSDTARYTITTKTGETRVFDKNGRLVKLVNNQDEASEVNITYTSSTAKQINTITDGAGRTYKFTYAAGQVQNLTYYGSAETFTEETKIARVKYWFDGWKLVSITEMDGSSSRYTYNAKGFLTSAKDIDGYQLSYTYNVPKDIQPYRVMSVSERDTVKNADGGTLTFEYGHNQTTLTDHNKNKEILHFNDQGNILSIQDDEGHAQFSQYAQISDADPTAKANQLRLSSKLQNTVSNLLSNSSFEGDTLWTLDGAGGTQEIDTAEKYLGTKSLLVRGGVYGPSFTVEAGATYTFSAYAKSAGDVGLIGIRKNGTIIRSTDIPICTDWVRYEVNFTNDESTEVQIQPVLSGQSQQGVYFDCVQLEKEPTASRYNLVDNGDFRYSGGWEPSSKCAPADARITVADIDPAASGLDNTCFKFTGDTANFKNIKQTVVVDGEEGDSFVLAGWAKGPAVPLSGDRKFALRARFNYTDGTTSDYASASFNPTTAQWQYSAAALVAEKPYSSILVAAVYDYCLNTVYFDGIQLFKEEFGSSYTYDEDGNLISVVDLQKKNTTYEYESNDLTAILEDNKAKMRYEYDAYHNVTKAITQKENEAGETVDGIVYEFAYDKWGNNTELKVTSGEITITTSATYTDDHNRMATSTDDLANVTTYCYNEDTNVLEWVQYPGDTETGRTTYTYDEMYRTATTAVNVPNLVGGSKLSVNYTFENDLLTKIKTPSTEYTFSYGAFAQRSSIKAGNHLLAEYKYSEDANRYLEKLTYGNGDFVEHDYDDKGRILSDTYSNGDTVTYTYDNDGNLASVTDSATGITTTYYYDLLGRQMKYAERSGQTELHSVEYGYNSENNLSAVTETVNGATHKTEYDYDSENRLTETDYGSRIEKITYDDFGRMSSTALEIEAEEPAEGEEAAENESVTQTTFQYQTEGNRTSSKLSAMTVAGSVDTLDSRYTYDAKGNITRYQLLDEDSETVEDIYYHYDTANQLVREDNFRTNTTTRWVYDTAGNIRYRKEYAYTTAVIENWDSLIAKKTVEYTYGDTSWGDLLTAYDGAPITYDAIGNPLSNGRWHYTWQNGRELASMERSDGSATWDYTYDVSGMRISRKNGSTVYNYVYTGSQLTQMTVGNDTLFFTYGVLGPTTVTWNGTTYYYALNAQGDITGIFDSAGNCVVTYQYQNAWGYNPAPTGTLASTLGTLNPLRYRGYVYDTESGLYYLQSRYYDPEICRFINADVYPSTGQGLTGNNMFSYCGNNPTSRKDDGGKFWNIVIGAAVGAVVSAVTTAIDTYTTTGSIDWGKVGISAAVGAVSGGVAATGLGTIAQAAISAGASAIGSVATDLYDRSKDPNAGKITWKEVGGIATRAIGSAAIGFGSSVFGTAAGKIVSGGIGAKGASMVFKGKIGAGCWTKAQARNMVSQGKVLINTARGLSSVVGTLFTWPTSTALSLGLSK